MALNHCRYAQIGEEDQNRIANQYGKETRAAGTPAIQNTRLQNIEWIRTRRDHDHESAGDVDPRINDTELLEHSKAQICALTTDSSEASTKKVRDFSAE